MKTDLSKKEAQEKITEFFNSDFSKEEMKKIKRLAMKYKIKLGDHRKQFCKSCLSQLKGELRISRTKNAVYKTIICNCCNTRNKFKI
jgi:RNase P subunit RPR2